MADSFTLPRKHTAIDDFRASAIRATVHKPAWANPNPLSSAGRSDREVRRRPFRSAFSAAVTVGVITLAEALAAVALRGRLMEEACAEGDWGMAAVSGLPTRSACQIANRVAIADDPSR